MTTVEVSHASLRDRRGPFVDDVLQPVRAFQRMKRVAAEANRDRPRTGDHEIYLRPVLTGFGSVRQAIPGLRLRAVRDLRIHRNAGEELSFAGLERLARLAIEDRD